jgi:hypothetical protein
MQIADIGRLVLVLDDEGEPQGLELLFEDIVQTPEQAAEALDGLRRALDSAKWIANTAMRVGADGDAERSEVSRSEGKQAEAADGGGANA